MDISCDFLFERSEDVGDSVYRSNDKVAIPFTSFLRSGLLRLKIVKLDHYGQCSDALLMIDSHLIGRYRESAYMVHSARGEIPLQVYRKDHFVELFFLIFASMT